MATNHIHIVMTNADVFTIDKQIELKNRIENENPHVIMISEVKPKIHKRTLTPIEYKVEGYDMVMKNLENVNKDLESKEINLKANFDEYIAIEVKLNDSEEILLVNIYRSPSSSDDNCAELNNMLSELAGLKYQHKVIGETSTIEALIGNTKCVQHLLTARTFSFLRQWEMPT